MKVAEHDLDEVARLILLARPYGPLHGMAIDGDMGDDSLSFCAGLTDEDWTADDRACLRALSGLSVAERMQAWERAEA